LASDTADRGARADLAIETRGLNLWYGDFQALFDVDLKIKNGIITSLIGPSGCGKTTFLRSINLFSYRLHHPEHRRLPRSERDEIVESALSQVLLWDAVKDYLDRPARELSLEEQQKLCIARLLPVKPTLLLMDEPCSALDPDGTEAVEDLIWELRGQYTILIVTHNMAQARRASDECIFMLLGKVIEHTATAEMFVTPQHEQTADYIEGRYG
jgi:phosphate transport system ATP-binding protein